jgi:hypothetical protein
MQIWLLQVKVVGFGSHGNLGQRLRESIKNEPHCQTYLHHKTNLSHAPDYWAALLISICKDVEMRLGWGERWSNLTHFTCPTCSLHTCKCTWVTLPSYPWTLNRKEKYCSRHTYTKNLILFIRDKL